ncbi:MAG: archaemetzincin [Planctomycetota bacterium]|jgi:archaemetzincin
MKKRRALFVHIALGALTVLLMGAVLILFLSGNGNDGTEVNEGRSPLEPVPGSEPAREEEPVGGEKDSSPRIAEGRPGTPAPVPRDGFVRKAEPVIGEWLYHFREDGQTFDAYVGDCGNRRRSARETFYLQPFGDLDAEELKVVRFMAEYAGIFFDLPVKVLPLRGHYRNGYVKSRAQWNASMLMGQLQESLPDDALIFVGITDADLFSGDLNFVFGQASLRERTGVYSLIRLHDRDGNLFLRRSLDLMAHEVGHIVSVEHCIEFECVMNGSNSLRESDRQPPFLCPDDLRKLEWNLGFDRKERYTKLEAFWRKYGFGEQADWYRKRLSAMEE